MGMGTATEQTGGATRPAESIMTTEQTDLTVRELAAALRRRAEEYHVGAISYEEFDARNRKDWREASYLGISARVAAEVSR